MLFVYFYNRTGESYHGMGLTTPTANSRASGAQLGLSTFTHIMLSFHTAFG